MLWFTNHFSCIYFCRNWPLQRTVRVGLHSECPEPCIKAPWCGLSRPDGKFFIRVEWKNQFLSRYRYHFTEPSLSLRGIYKDVRCRGEPKASSFSAVTLPFRAERNASWAFFSPWESIKQASKQTKIVIKGAGVSARCRWRDLWLGPAQIGFQEGVPITTRTFYPLESVGLLSFIPALLLFSPIHSVSFRMPRAWDEFGAFP